MKHYDLSSERTIKTYVDSNKLITRNINFQMKLNKHPFTTATENPYPRLRKNHKEKLQ